MAREWIWKERETMTYFSQEINIGIIWEIRHLKTAGKKVKWHNQHRKECGKPSKNK